MMKQSKAILFFILFITNAPIIVSSSVTYVNEIGYQGTLSINSGSGVTLNNDQYYVSSSNSSSNNSVQFTPTAISCTNSLGYTTGTISYNQATNELSIDTATGSGVFTNNAPFEVTLLYSNGSIAASLNTGATYTYSAGQYLITSISPASYSQSLSPTQASIVFILNSSGQITLQGFNLTNNYTQTAQSVTFYNASDGTTGTGGNIAYESLSPIPSNTTYVQWSETFGLNSSAVTLQIPISASNSQNMFGNGLIVNRNTSSYYLNFTGSINNVTTSLNPTADIYLTAEGATNSSLPIMANAQEISIYSSSSSLLYNQSIDPDTTYYVTINSQGNVVLTTIEPDTLTNNYNQTTGSITAQTASATSSITPINAWQSTSVPANATLTCNGLAENSTFTLMTQTNNVSIYTNSIITNNSTDTTDTLFINSYSDTATTDLVGGYSITAGQSLPLVTGVQSIELLVNGISQATAVITAETSYQITYSNSTWTITSYTPLISNNYPTTNTASTLQLYNSNATLIATISSLGNGQTADSVTNGSYLTLQDSAYVDSNGNSVTLTIPLTFPTTLPLFNGYTLTNNTQQEVLVNFYGNYNTLTNTLLNTAPLAIESGAYLAIPTGVLSVAVYQSSNLITPVIPQTSVVSGNNYDINFDNSQWSLNTFPENYTLTNNATQPTGQITLYNGSTQLAQVSSLAASTATQLPQPTTIITAEGLLNTTGTFTIQTPTTITTDINLYTAYQLTNNTASQLTITCYGSNSSSQVNGSISMNTQTSTPIIYSTTGISVATSSGTVIGYTPLNTTTNYYINFDDNVWSLNTFEDNYILTNNNYYETGPITFYEGDTQLAQVSYLVSFGNTPLPEPTTTIIAEALQDGTTAYANGSFTLQMPSPITSNINMYTSYEIITNSSSVITVTCYGLHSSSQVNGSITMPPGSVFPLVYSTTGLSVATSSGTVIPYTPISLTTNYYINFDNNQWSLNTFAETYVITNNANQTTGTITFYDEAGIISSVSTVSAWTSTAIPTITTYVTIEDLPYATSTTTIQLTAPITESLDIYTNYALTNLTSTALDITLYGSDSLSQSNGTFTLPAASSILIPYSTTGVSAMPVSGGGTPISYTSITNSTSYAITHDVQNNSYNLNAYTPSIINNDANSSASNLVFYTAQGIGSTAYGTGQNFNGGDTASIPANCVIAQVTDTTLSNTTLTIPVSLQPTSYLFSQDSMGNTYTITNYAEQSVYVTFFGTINGVNQMMNAGTIALTAGQSIPILTNASTINVQTGNGTNVLLQQPLEEHRSYFIDENINTNTWSFTTTVPNTSVLCINNDNRTLSNLAFYSALGNGNYEQIGQTLANFDAYSSVFIPENSVYATFIDGDQNSTITIPVSTLTDTNAWNNAVIINASTSSLQLNFYGTINGVSNIALTTPSITAVPNGKIAIPNAPDLVVSIITSDGSQMISSSLQANTSYYVENNNTTLTITETNPSPTVQFCNNSAQTITSISFYNADNVQQGTTGSLNAYEWVTIPSTSVYASVINDQNILMSTAVSDGTSSTLFTNYTILNNADQSIDIIFQGTLNNGQQNPQNINNPAFSSNQGDTIPIITGASSFSYTYNGLPQTQSINPCTNYTINADGSISSSNPYLLTNNSGQNGSNLTFYDGNTELLPITATLYNGVGIQIPEGSTSAVFTQTYNDSNTTITVPVTDSANSNVVTQSYINNNTPDTVTLLYYGTVNNIPDTPMNNPNISAASTTFIPIPTEATTVSVYSGSTLVINQAELMTATNYYINYQNGTWSLDSYASMVNITNNYSQNGTNLIFYQTNNSGGITPCTSPVNCDSFTSLAIPMNSIAATLDILGTTITIPLSDTTTTTVFNTTNATIINQSTQTIYVGYTGILQTNPISSAYPLTSSGTNAIAVEPGNATLIITGAAMFSIYDSIGDTVINNYPVSGNQSYSVTNDITSAHRWIITPALSTSTLTNNYNQTITSMKFYDTTGTQQASTIATLLAFDIVSVPITAATASFNDSFTGNSTTVTIPVSAITSSNIFAQHCTLTNNTLQSVYLSMYDTGATLLNNQLIEIPSNTSVPLLAATSSFTLSTSSTGSPIVFDSTSYQDPLPLRYAYNIFNDAGWYIIPTTLTLTNNFYAPITAINFFDANNSLISTGSVQPWAAIDIPDNAVSATITYDTLAYNTGILTIPLSSTRPSRVFASSLLTNNSLEDLSIIFYTGTENRAINDTAYIVLAGASIPFIQGTTSITALLNDTVVIQNYPITLPSSYQIIESASSKGYTMHTNTRNDVVMALAQAFKDSAAGSQIKPSSSAVGIIRFIGNSSQSASALQEIQRYGVNTTLFTQFLYITKYAQVINDQNAQTATIDAVNALLQNYAYAYKNQPNFNYIASLNLINPQLDAAQAVLLSQYPSSASEITLFFTYFKKRNKLLMQ